MFLSPTSLLPVALVVLSHYVVAQELVADFTIDGTSPMLWGNNEWRIDEATYNRTSFNMRTSPSDLIVNFVGNGFKLYGHIEIPGQTSEGDLGQCSINSQPPKLIFETQGEGVEELVTDVVDGTTLYNLTIDHDINTRMTFHHLSFEMRIKTEAPSFEALNSSATDIPVVQNNGQNPAIELSQSSAYYNFLSADTLELFAGTELRYSPPANSSLIEVRGPVKAGGLLSSPNGEICAARLDPLPSWWNETAGPPLAWQRGPMNVSRQVLFLLPLDPTVRYTLTLLPQYTWGKCSVSMIRTFPYVYTGSDANKSAGSASTSSSGSSAPSAGTASRSSAPASQSSGGNASREDGKGRGPVIAGAVVGALVGVAILVALVVWLTRRHLVQQQQTERTLPQDDFEVDATDGPDAVLTPFVEVAQGESATAHPTSVKPPAAGASGKSHRAGQQSASPLVIQEEDAEDVEAEERPIEVLPPRYRPAWEHREFGAGASATPVSHSEKGGHEANEGLASSGTL